MISIVSPVYQAEESIPLLVNQLVAAMSSLSVDFEIILVDDRSRDSSWQKMLELAKVHPVLKCIRLSRNFGQHPAIMAGLSRASGHWIVVMDCDLQDQPKEIAKLYSKALEGYDAVVALRTNRQDSFSKKTLSRLFSLIFNFLADTNLDYRAANFGIYNQKVIAEVLRMGDAVKSFPLFVQFVGFKTTTVEVEHASRPKGESSYSLVKAVNLAVNSIFAFSNKLLWLVVKLGIVLSAISFVLAGYFLTGALLHRIEVPGYASLIVALFFLSGVTICAVGIVGIYISYIFEQVKHRASYIVDCTLGFTN